MTEELTVDVRLTAEQVETLRRELASALDALDSLEHLCSVQAIATRLEEAISAALYIVERAETRQREASA